MVRSNGVINQSATSCTVAEMILHGVSDDEVMRTWLQSVGCGDYANLFIDSGYNMPTMSRMTPQDLSAVGVNNPEHRLKIMTEIKKLNLSDSTQTLTQFPDDLKSWLDALALDSTYYCKLLCDQNFDSLDKVCQLDTHEDLEDIGIHRLGHIKRILLGIKKLKELKLKNDRTRLTEPIYDTCPNQMILVNASVTKSLHQKQQIYCQPSLLLHQHSRLAINANDPIGSEAASSHTSSCQSSPSQSDYHQAYRYQYSHTLSANGHQQTYSAPQLPASNNIYATVGRQRNPPPVPVRTNSLRTANGPPISPSHRPFGQAKMTNSRWLRNQTQCVPNNNNMSDIMPFKETNSINYLSSLNLNNISGDTSPSASSATPRHKALEDDQRSIYSERLSILTRTTSNLIQKLRLEPSIMGRQQSAYDVPDGSLPQTSLTGPLMINTHANNNYESISNDTMSMHSFTTSSSSQSSGDCPSQSQTLTLTTGKDANFPPPPDPLDFADETEDTLYMLHNNQSESILPSLSSKESNDPGSLHRPELKEAIWPARKPSQLSYHNS